MSDDEPDDKDKNGKASPQSAGGIARADALTASRRRAIAKKAANARWDKSAPRATHEGTLKIGEVAFPCSVLEDGTRVLTETKFMAGMGMYRSGALSTRRADDDGGARPPLYLAFKNLIPYVSKHLAGVHADPLLYRTLRGSLAHGIRADLIPKICDVWLDARTDGVLGTAQMKVAAKAERLLRGLAHVGIIALVDEATGYQAVRPADALQAYLDRILGKELTAWSKKFPDEFYENIYKLKGWKWPGMQKNRYSVVAHYTRDLIYDRLAPGLLKELETRSPKNEKGERPNKLHQWLNLDLGCPLFSQHMHSIVMFQRLAVSSGYGYKRYVRMVDKVLPRKGSTLELPLMDPGDPTAP